MKSTRCVRGELNVSQSKESESMGQNPSSSFEEPLLVGLNDFIDQDFDFDDEEQEEEEVTIFSQSSSRLTVNCVSAHDYYKTVACGQSNVKVATQKLTALHCEFDQHVVQLFRAAKQTWQKDENDGALQSPVKLQCSTESDEQDEENAYEGGKQSNGSLNSDSHNYDANDNGRFKDALKELERKRRHPARLHPDIWYNDAGQLNDGPSCRCCWRARQKGISHGKYPGEARVEPCDPLSNNANRLHYYRVVIKPQANLFQKFSITEIEYKDKLYSFDGFGILSHELIDRNMPLCRLNRWNIDYEVSLVEEVAPDFFSVRDLDLFWEYVFVELLELYDVRLFAANVEDGCPIFHIYPRFVCKRKEKTGGGCTQQLLPMSVVLQHLLQNCRLIFDQPAERGDFNDRVSKHLDKFSEKLKGQVVANPWKRPVALRLDQLDRMQKAPDGYSVIVHFGRHPTVTTYAGTPEYQRAWKRFAKFRRVVMLQSYPRTEDRAKLAKMEAHLTELKAKNSVKRDLIMEVSCQGFMQTGIWSDVVQHCLILLVLLNHIRFHRCLRVFQQRIDYSFRKPSLLELAFTHPSYRADSGTNADHVRNVLNNCGLRQLEFGSKRANPWNSRKRGVSCLVDVMSRMGEKKSRASSTVNNERLEYLGDAVIEFLTTIHLFYIFPDLEEGALAPYRTLMVQNSHLSKLAAKMGLDEFMLFAHGPDLCFEEDMRHAMANAFEAILGAVYLDGGVKVADRVFGRFLFPPDWNKALHWVWFHPPRHPLQQEYPDGDRHLIHQCPTLQKLTEFERRIGVRFNHIRLLARAFTRKCVGYNFLTLGHNQRLEFLGDSVLQLVTTEYLYKHFPDHQEGHLSLLRSSLVNNRTQAVICDDLEIPNFILQPPAFLRNEPQELRMKDKADLVEAFLGALFVDHSLDYCAAFVRHCFLPRLKQFIEEQRWCDPKSQLQQCCLALRNPSGGDPDMPVYKVVCVEGPTNTRVYRVAVYFRGERLATGEGHSVKQAEMNAAKNALRAYRALFPQIFRNHNNTATTATTTTAPLPASSSALSSSLFSNPMSNGNKIDDNNNNNNNNSSSSNGYCNTRSRGGSSSSSSNGSNTAIVTTTVSSSGIGAVVGAGVAREIYVASLIGIIIGVIMNMAIETTEASAVKEEIWSKILCETQSRSKCALPTASVIVLGDSDSGKTSMVARLQGVEEPKKGAGFEYHYLEINPDYKVGSYAYQLSSSLPDISAGDVPRLGVWVLDGDPLYAPLLRFALPAENLKHSVALVCCSMAEPWNIGRSLQRWTDVLEKHLNESGLYSTHVLSECRERQVRFWQEYVEPLDSSSHSELGQKVPSMEPDQILLPLGQSTLTRNLGLPLIVVVTKCDLLSSYEKQQFDLKDEDCDLIQKQIRQFCLKHGAALVYTNVKDGRNCDLLYKYILHRVFGFPFTQPACVIDKEAMFIPAGWDNEKKISIIEDGLPDGAEQDFLNRFNDQLANLLNNSFNDNNGINVGDANTSTVGIGNSSFSGCASQKELEMKIEDEQAFLARLQTLLNTTLPSTQSPGQHRQDGSSPMPMSITSPRHSSDKSRPSAIGQSSNGLFSSTASTAGGSATIAQSKKADSIGKMAMQTCTGTGTGVVGAAGSVGGGSVGPSSEGALAQFFNNLLIKRPASASTGAAGSAKLNSESSSNRERTFDDSESETQAE
ncbi:Ribonuclease 3 [Trichinella pseudospiralis]|uniref:Ribonuclease 3 n=1 Tax=Trichinella pseudospiralis TaxID=6337 RepID=A0A0V1FUY7_TRIPS|nr:Ribonuclease 3 [Trichinella pseudospiralis]